MKKLLQSAVLTVVFLAAFSIWGYLAFVRGWY